MDGLEILSETDMDGWNLINQMVCVITFVDSKKRMAVRAERLTGAERERDGR